MARRNLIKHLPVPLLDDLVEGRWLPIVGAGMSRNALLPGRPEGLPDWAGLAKAVAADLPPEYGKGTPLETLSAYEHAFGRARLIERVMRALHVREAYLGEVHKAFCKIPFETVVTTNVEQLLEAGYRARHGDAMAIIEEDQLRLGNPYDAPTLIKLHGDLHHPSSLVLTERDYDEFTNRRPMFVTWLANQLISKTGVLIGYSLEDADFRQILATMRSRLGESAPDLYVIEVGADPVRVDRYTRRGVRVINLPSNPRGYGLLADLFDELYDRWGSEAPKHLQATSTSVRALLKSGSPSPSAVLFVVPDDVSSLYDDFVYPEVSSAGKVPVTRQDVTHPSGYRLATNEALLGIAGRVVVHADRLDDSFVQKAIGAVGSASVLVVGRPGVVLDKGLRFLPLPQSADEWVNFGQQVADWAREPTAVGGSLDRFTSGRDQSELPSRTINLLIALEGTLRRIIPAERLSERSRGRAITLASLLDEANRGFELGLSSDDQRLMVDTRNQLVHGLANVSAPQMRRCLELAERVLSRLPPGIDS